MEKFKNEFLFGFSNEKLDEALDIIYFIGLGQNYAWSWSQNNGVLQSDIKGDPDFIGYLEQTTFDEFRKNYVHKVYRLNDFGEKIFINLLQKFKSREDYKYFLIDSALINKNIFSFHKFDDNLSDIPSKLEDCSRFSDLFSDYYMQLDIWSEISSIYEYSLVYLTQLINKSKLYIDLTGFKAKKEVGNKRILIHQNIKMPYNKAQKIFELRFSDTMKLIQDVYNPLLKSIKDPSIRKNLKPYIVEIRKIIEITSSKRITTPIIDDPKLFRTYKDEEFRLVLLKRINSLFKPIGDFLLQREPISVFFSYSAKDFEKCKVKEISEKLEDKGMVDKVYFWHKHKEETITIEQFEKKFIEKANMVIVLTTKNSFNSGVEDEIEISLEEQKICLPLFDDEKNIKKLIGKSIIGIKLDLNNIDSLVSEIYDVILKKFFQNMKY